MSLDQATLDKFESMIKTAFDKQSTDIEAKITAQINNITKNNNENTEQIKSPYPD